jgi:hypothetical protein
VLSQLTHHHQTSRHLYAPISPIQPWQATEPAYDLLRRAERYLGTTTSWLNRHLATGRGKLVMSTTTVTHEVNSRVLGARLAQWMQLNVCRVCHEEYTHQLKNTGTRGGSHGRRRPMLIGRSRVRIQAKHEVHLGHASTISTAANHHTRAPLALPITNRRCTNCTSSRITERKCHRNSTSVLPTAPRSGLCHDTNVVVAHKSRNT